MTTVDVRECTAPSGDYRALTARAAIHAHIHRLEKGQAVTLGPLIDMDGTKRSRRYLQVRVIEITPRGWKLVTRAVGPNTIYVLRES